MIIFLDCDGVLRPWPVTPKWGDTAATCRLDPRRCTLLEELVARTAARVVLITSWCAGRGPEAIEVATRILHRHMPTLPISGTVPWPRRGLLETAPHRARSIATWLATHPGDEPWVVLDDDSDSLPVAARRLVQVQASEGLTHGAADFATLLLFHGPRAAWRQAVPHVDTEPDADFGPSFQPTLRFADCTVARFGSSRWRHQSARAALFRAVALRANEQLARGLLDELRRAELAAAIKGPGNLPPGVEEWAWGLASVDGNVDNLRVADRRKRRQVRRYHAQRAQGRCGARDVDAVGPDGRGYLVGWNFGH